MLYICEGLAGRARCHHRTLLPSGLWVEHLEVGVTEIVAVARSRLTSCECPACGRASSRIHSRYGDCPIYLLTAVGAELLFEVFSQRYERGSTLITSNLPFDEWTSVFGSERLTGALLDRLTHHVHILEMNGDSFRLATSKKAQGRASQTKISNAQIQAEGDDDMKI